MPLAYLRIVLVGAAVCAPKSKRTMNSTHWISPVSGGGYWLFVTLHRIDRRCGGLVVVLAAHWLALLSSPIVYHVTRGFSIGKIYEMHNLVL